MNNFRSIPDNSVITGAQIQKDAVTTSLTVACDPHLLVPEISNGKPNPVFDKKKDGKSAIAVDVCCLETPCDDQSGGGGGGGGAVNSVISANSATITIGGPASNPTIGANTQPIVVNGPHLATGGQIHDYVNTKLAGGPLTYEGGYNANANSPNLTGPGLDITKGWTFTVTAAGSFYSETVEIGDLLIAQNDILTGAGALSDWTTVQNNVGEATASTFGLVSVPISGGLDITGGVISLPDIPLVAGNYDSADIVVDDKGRVISATSVNVIKNFSLDGDNGGAQPVADGDTVQILGGSQINTVASANTTLTINLDNSLTLTDLTVTNPISGSITGSANIVTNPSQSAITSVGTLTGLTVNGNTTIGPSYTNTYPTKFQVDGYASIGLPFSAGDFWGINANNAASFWTPYGYLGTNGSFDLALSCNGYRNTSSEWTSLGANGSTSAGLLSLRPADGSLRYYAASNFPTGTTSVGPPERFRVAADGSTSIFQSSATYTFTSASTSGYTCNFNIDNTALTISHNSNSRSIRMRAGTSANGVQLNPGASSWTTISDERLKNDIENISGAVSKIMDISGITYTIRDDLPIDHSNNPKQNNNDTEYGPRRRVGLIAQQVQKVLPEAVYKYSMKDDNGDNEDYLGIAYTEVIPLLVEAIKEQQKNIEILESRIATLENAQ